MTEKKKPYTSQTSCRNSDVCYMNQILKGLSSPRDGIALKCLKLTESIWDAKEINVFSYEMVGFILHRLL